MFTPLPALDGRPNPCGCCPPIPAVAPMDKIIAVGFGGAYVTRDEETVLDGEARFHAGEDFATFADAEALAETYPESDWRVVLDGPLHGETYQRQGARLWVLVEKNQGFA